MKKKEKVKVARKKVYVDLCTGTKFGKKKVEEIEEDTVVRNCLILDIDGDPMAYKAAENYAMNCYPELALSIKEVLKKVALGGTRTLSELGAKNHNNIYGANKNKGDTW